MKGCERARRERIKNAWKVSGNVKEILLGSVLDTPLPPASWQACLNKLGDPPEDKVAFRMW